MVKMFHICSFCCVLDALNKKLFQGFLLCLQLKTLIFMLMFCLFFYCLLLFVQERMANDPNTYSYSSSTVMSYSNDGRGEPKYFQASKSTKHAPGGVSSSIWFWNFSSLSYMYTFTVTDVHAVVVWLFWLTHSNLTPFNIKSVLLITTEWMNCMLFVQHLSLLFMLYRVLTELWILEKVLKFAWQYSRREKVWKLEIKSGKW